eukprot:CAMPEP_0184648316 /NCGR_PEP_ID=MMETSP0308-20130426/5405_1 /TAXON_ID=38269 /ORGANISM="Gloeochaete witrockiana, Strain SAG 46.84" /LENGTH=444 /DNA_ID=CAMNT_0027080045 /DNA_START=247 /DNA_END=1582 /DNA_ORIENTATION=+
MSLDVWSNRAFHASPVLPAFFIEGVATSVERVSTSVEPVSTSVDPVSTFTASSSEHADVEGWKRCLLDAGIPEDQASNIVAKYPRILKYSVEERASAAVAFLRTKGFSADDIRGMITRYPVLLTFGVSRRLQPVWDMLCNEGLDPRIVLRRYPATFDCNLEVGIGDKLRALQRVGVRGSAVLTKAPNLLRFSANDQLKPTLDFLVSVGFNAQQLEELVEKKAWILKRDLNKKLIPVVTFLKKQLMMSAEEVTQVLTTCPQFFGFGVENLTMKMKWLHSIGLTPEDIKDMIIKVPFTFTLDQPTALKPKVVFMIEQGVTDEDLVKVLKLVPRFFTMSLENEIAPKWDFIVKTMKRSVAEILEDPVPFFYSSYYRRVLPRFRYLQDKGLDDAFTISQILRPAEAKFLKDIAKGSGSEYAKVKNECRKARGKKVDQKQLMGDPIQIT